jgi:hypothetical protein
MDLNVRQVAIVTGVGRVAGKPLPGLCRRRRPRSGGRYQLKQPSRPPEEIQERAARHSLSKWMSPSGKMSPI